MSAALIDTHAHLDFDRFDADRDDVIYRAKEANVAGIINIGIDLATTKKSIEIASSRTNVFSTGGIHPHDVAEATDDQVLELKELIKDEKIVAIGEVGLDFYRNISPADVQRRYFRMFLNWAEEFDLPLVIHTRDASEDIISIIQDRHKTGWKGVFHCFSGDERMADKILEMGFYISFTGNITYKNSQSADVMKYVPIQRLLLETDCPFLSPEPHRGKRNEPAYVRFVAQKIAEEKSLSFDQVATITTENACRLFNIELAEES